MKNEIQLNAVGERPSAINKSFIPASVPYFTSVCKDMFIDDMLNIPEPLHLPGELIFSFVYSYFLIIC
jgi:hypothetical protein